MIIYSYKNTEIKIRKQSQKLKNRDQTKPLCKIEYFFDWISSRRKSNHPKSSFCFFFVFIYDSYFFLRDFSDFLSFFLIILSVKDIKNFHLFIISKD
jgi:hypothetical protein